MTNWYDVTLDGRVAAYGVTKEVRIAVRSNCDWSLTNLCTVVADHAGDAAPGLSHVEVNCYRMYEPPSSSDRRFNKILDIDAVLGI